MTAAAERTVVAGWRATVDTVYAYGAGLFAVGVLVQVFLAGVGAFGDHAGNVKNAPSFGAHRTWGTLLGFIAVALFLVAVSARATRGTWIGALVLAVLSLAAQPALAGGGDNNRWVGGLHALDGMAILILSFWL